MNTISSPWTFFDKIYCISIDTRIDRRTEAKKQFALCGLENRAEFVIVQKHPVNQEQGIFESHIYCLKKGLEARARHILIFEDDIFIKNFHPESLSSALQFLGQTSHWEAFFLGAISSNSMKTTNKNIVAIRYRCLAHAYCLHHDFARHISTLPWSGIPFDNLLQQQCKKGFALSPMIAFQSSATTDNQTILLDRMRRYCGGLPFIQRANEFFHKHKAIILLLHLVTLLIFVFFAVLK